MSNPRTKPQPVESEAATPRTSANVSLWIVTAICAIVALVVVAIAFMLTSARDPTSEHINVVADTEASKDENIAEHAPPAATGSLAAAPPTNELVDDDGQTLWASPTDGPPLDLAYLPPGAQIIVALRPDSLAAHPEGDKIFDALEPLGAQVVEYVNEVSLQPTSREQAVIGLYPANDGGWQHAIVMRLGGERTAAEHVTARLPNGRQVEQDGASYWLAEPWAYLVAPDDDRLLVVAPADSIADVIALAGDPPPLRRDIERLLAHTDADRHVTILFAPLSLFSEVSTLFRGELTAVRDPLFWFLGDEFSAAALSFHWSENFFIEFMAAPTLETPPDRAAAILADRLREVPDRVDRHLEQLDLSPHGRELIGRFPAMLSALATYTRSGFDRDTAVLRAYLPAAAGHNLAMAAELALAESLGGPRPAPEAKPQTIDQRLQRVATVRFARDTLESALDQLSQEIGAPVVIRGADLQAEGITKNQSFGIDMTDKPTAEILVEILRLANPDKSATSPADPRQKLVYTIGRGEEGGTDEIFITTRTAAVQRGEQLPAIFTTETP